MGGIVIIIATLVGYATARLATWSPPTTSGLLVLGLVTSLGLVGFLDDWIKISRARSLGLHSTAKLALQTTIAVAFGILAFAFPNERGLTPASQYVSFLRDLPWLWLPLPLAVVWIVLIISSWSNAANLTDGLDGLASGAATMVFAAYTIINVWQYNQSCAWGDAGPQCYEVRDPLDLAVVSIESDPLIAERQATLIDDNDGRRIVLLQGHLTAAVCETWATTCDAIDTTLLLAIIHWLDDPARAVAALSSMSNRLILEVPHPDDSGACTVSAERISVAPFTCASVGQQELASYKMTRLLPNYAVYTDEKEPTSSVSLIDSPPGCLIIRRYVEYGWRDPAAAPAAAPAGAGATQPPKKR